MAHSGSETIIANRYIVQNELGKGGMGAVYRVRDRLYSKDHFVALKRVFADGQNLIFNTKISSNASTTSLNTALAEEFRILASLRHPNIISVLDYGFDEFGRPYFTMDLMSDAKNILQADLEASPIEKVKLAIQMLQALDYLHQRGIIHRDLKPNNVLVSNGQVKVLDFGLAVKKEASQDKTITGTFAYITPEILQMQAATLASDLFSAGIILYEMLTGQHPFHDQNLSVMISHILTRPVDTSPINELEVPDAGRLVDVVDKMLSKNPKERYQQAYQVIEDLCKALDIPLPEESENIRESFLQSATFIGRENELEQLNSALSDAKKKQGSLWLIGGESGVGKSRLAEEMRIQALVRAVTVIKGHAISETGTPYHLWKPIIRRMLVMLEVSDEQAGIIKHILPEIDNFLQRPVTLTETDDYREKLEETFFELLEKLPQVFIILEDMQWADNASLELLQKLDTKISTLPILLTATYRSDENAGLADNIENAEQIMLKRLDETGIEALAIAMLGKNNVTDSLIDLLQRETEGNLFFLVEVMRALADEAGQLRAITQIDLPQTVAAHGVSAVLERRLNHVPEWGQPLIKQAAIAGRELDIAVIESLRGDVDLELWLSTCVNVALLDAVEEDYRFAHDKLREMLVNQLDEADLKQSHRDVAIAIETVHHADDYAQALAFHWQKAGDFQKEFDYTLKSNTKLQDLAFHIEALPQSRRLFELYDILKMDDEVMAAELHFNIGYNYHGVGEFDLANEHYLKNLSISEKIDNPSMVAQVLGNLGVLARLTGDFEAALNYGERTIEVAKRSDNHSATATAYVNTGIINAMQGNVPEAKTHFLNAKNLSEEHNIDSTLSTSLISLGILHSMIEEFNEAKQSFSAAMQVMEREHNYSNMAACALSLGDVHLALEEYGDAFKQYHYGMKTASDAGVPSIVLNGMISIAHSIFKREQAEKYIWAVQLLHMANLHPLTDYDNKQKTEQIFETYKELLQNADISTDEPPSVDIYPELIEQCMAFLSGKTS